MYQSRIGKKKLFPISIFSFCYPILYNGKETKGNFGREIIKIKNNDMWHALSFSGAHGSL